MSTAQPGRFPGQRKDRQMTTTEIKLPNPPSVARRWRVTLPHPRGGTMAAVLAHDPDSRMTDEECDAWAAALPWPTGWTVISTMQASSGARGPILPTDRRTLIVTLVPTTWTDDWQVRADLGIYAAAQLVGLRTNLDDYISVVADIGQWAVQRHDPDGRPIGREPIAMPEAIRAELDRLISISHQRSLGYMWARPDTGRAMDAAEREARGDNDRHAQAAEAIRAWVRANHAAILA